jgi:hypothetical protein
MINARVLFVNFVILRAQVPIRIGSAVVATWMNALTFHTSNGPTFEEMKAELALYDKPYLSTNMSYMELKEYYLKVHEEKKFSKLDKIVKDAVVYPILTANRCTE